MSRNEDLEIDKAVYVTIGLALDLPDGDEKIAMMEEAVRIADRGHDIELQYFARDEFLNAAYWGGAPEKALVAYSWCLAQFDRYPGKFREHNLLWTYKWMINTICHFPQIPKEQIYGMLDDMTRRYQQSGHGLRVIYQYRYRIESFFGNREEAIKNYRRARELSSDELSDCQACEIDERVSFQIYYGEYEAAIATASPLLEGRHKCRTVPLRTMARILVPLLHLGRREEAWQYHLQGYRGVTQKGFLSYAGDHLVYLSLAGRLEMAAELLETRYHWTEANTDAYNRFQFYRAAWLFLLIWTESRGASITLRLPSSFPLYAATNEYESARLASWFRHEAHKLAVKFDERAGNDHFRNELEGVLALRGLQG